MVFSCQHPQKIPIFIPALKFFQLLQNIKILIGAITFQHSASKPGHKVYSMSFRDIEQVLKSKVKTDSVKVLLESYKKFLKVLSYKEANELPSHCLEINYDIHIQPGT